MPAQPMNMPPLTYVKRIRGLDYKPLEAAYTDASVWQNFDPAVFTLCSPDPQAFRPPDEPPNVLQVTLPTNFKAARFDSDADTQILRDMQEDIENVRTIYHLVKQKGFTLQGAKDMLKNDTQAVKDKMEIYESLKKIRQFLVEVRDKLQ